MPRIEYSLIREDIIASLKLYAEKRCPTGGFLQAVLENDLSEACAHADEDNARNLFQIVAYVYNEMPSVCWGSPQKVAAWLKRKP